MKFIEDKNKTSISINELTILPLFTLKFSVNDSTFNLEYITIVECLTDTSIIKLFTEHDDCICHIWSGLIKINTHPIKNWNQLKEQIVKNSRSILHRYM